MRTDEAGQLVKLVSSRWAPVSWGSGRTFDAMPSNMSNSSSSSATAIVVERRASRRSGRWVRVSSLAADPRRWEGGTNPTPERSARPTSRQPQTAISLQQATSSRPRPSCLLLFRTITRTKSCTSDLASSRASRETVRADRLLPPLLPPRSRPRPWPDAATTTPTSLSPLHLLREQCLPLAPLQPSRRRLEDLLRGRTR